MVRGVDGACLPLSLSPPDRGVCYVLNTHTADMYSIYERSRKCSWIPKPETRIQYYNLTIAMVYKLYTWRGRDSKLAYIQGHAYLDWDQDSNLSDAWCASLCVHTNGEEMSKRKADDQNGRWDPMYIYTERERERKKARERERARAWEREPEGARDSLQTQDIISIKRYQNDIIK